MKKQVTAFFAIAFSLLSLSAQQATQNPACSCCTEDHRAFDFWIGEWEVEGADGRPAGTNRIVRSLDGCLIQEFWSSATPGFTGSSFNYFNQSIGQWEQLWVDNSGNILKLRGGRTGDQMILASEPAPSSGGTRSVNRITWTLNADETVRQVWEVLQDGQVVRVLFNGLYRKAQ